MRQTVNEITKRKQLYIGLIRGIVYSDDNYIEFGYFKPTVEMLKTNYEGKKYFDIRPNMQSEKIFSFIFLKALRSFFVNLLLVSILLSSNGLFGGHARHILFSSTKRALPFFTRPLALLG